MQSALCRQPDLTVKPANVTTLRIVTVDLRTGATHEYLYLLDNPKDNSTRGQRDHRAVDHTFLVDERDGNFPPGGVQEALARST